MTEETPQESGDLHPEEPDSDASLPGAESDPVPADPSQTAGTGTRAPLLLALAAAVAMVIGLLAWWQADHDEALARAAERDTLLIAARQHIETMNTLDHRKVEEGLADWESVTTGKLKDSIAQISDEEKQLLAEQKKISRGEVVDAAVTRLDADSATVIAAIEVTVEDGADPSAEPTVKRNRFSATLVKDGDEWLIEDLQQVAVTLS